MIMSLNAHSPWAQILVWVRQCNVSFLVACTRLYNPLCPSGGLSVGPSVRPSRLAFFAAPAHPHAIKVAVYPALFNETCLTFSRKMYSYGLHIKCCSSNMRFELKIAN